VTVQSVLLPERKEKRYIKIFHIVVFRQVGFLAIFCCFRKPLLKADFALMAWEKDFFSGIMLGVKFFICCLGCFSIERY